MQREIPLSGARLSRLTGENKAIPTITYLLNNGANPILKYMGLLKTLVRMRKKYFWTGISRDVQQHCDLCKLCHSRCNLARRRRHEFGCRPMIQAPLQRLSCDYDSIFLITDHLTHWAVAIPTKGETT
jgi:hypothetical protein